MKRDISRLLRMTALLFAASIAATIAAQENTSITVYATRIDSAKESIPAPITILSSSEISSSGARDLADLLKKKTLADVHTMGANPLLSSIALRGFGENAFGRVKVVLNGEELNNVDMSAPNLTRIALDDIERVEVLRGPNPVLYGDGAIAGVINVLSESPNYEKKTRVSAKAGSQNTFGGNFKTKGAIEEDGLQYSASYDYLQSGGYRRRSAYDLHTANAALRKNFENGAMLRVKANYQNAFYELPGALTFDQWKNHPKDANNEHDWTRLWSYGFGFDSKMKLAEDQWLRIDSTFSHQFRHARMYEWQTDNQYDNYSYALSPRYINETDIFDYGNKLTAGADLRYDKYTQTPKELSRRGFERFRCAAFAHEEFYLNDEIALTAGVRTESINNEMTYNVGNGESDSADLAFDFEIGVAYRPVDELKLYTKATRFHRSAFCDELNYTQNGRLLEPETGYGADVGAEWIFCEEFSGELTGYGMLMEDEIFFDPLIAPFGYNCNSPARTRRIGLDAAVSWSREKTAEASLRYAIVHADFAGGEYRGRDIPFVPNHRVRAEGGYYIFDDLKLKGGYSFFSSRYVSGDFSNANDKLAGYSLFDLGVYYTPSWAKGWKTSFTIDNLFNRNYCDYAGIGYYYPACARSFIFTIGYEF